MTQVFRYVIVLLLCFSFVYACSNKHARIPQKNNFVVIENKYYYPKIDSFVNSFDRKEFTYLHEQGLSYPVEDSLCFYFSKLDKKELLYDDEFKYMAGKLLEKSYLQVRESFYKPESFPVYNMEIYPTGGKLSHHFALNIILKNESCLDSNFVRYAEMKREFLCIDSVVHILDKLPQMQTDSIHRICKDLVDRNKTGGCVW